MSLFSINPLTLDDFDLSNPHGMKIWQQQVAQLFYQLTQNVQQLVQNPIFLAGILSPLNVSTDLGSVGTNQSVACDGASLVVVNLTITAALTLTLTHLRVGSYVVVRAVNNTAGALVFQLSATNPSGTTYTNVQAQNSADATIDVKNTGVSLPASTGTRVFVGGGTPSGLWTLVL